MHVNCDEKLLIFVICLIVKLNCQKYCVTHGRQLDLNCLLCIANYYLGTKRFCIGFLFHSKKNRTPLLIAILCVLDRGYLGYERWVEFKRSPAPRSLLGLLCAPTTSCYFQSKLCSVAVIQLG